MIRAINRLLLLILITNSLYSVTRQVNIYLMEYDNLNQSIRYNTLGRELPNLVKEEFSSIIKNNDGDINALFNDLKEFVEKE